MRFVGTERFSPVARSVDLPWKEDYFHIPNEQLTKEKIENSIIDENWWYIQRDRCLNGYEVEGAIEKGGDAIVDGRDAIWYGDDCYLPEYDLWIKNKKVKISGRFYWYLNFWHIYGLDHEKGYKTIINPRFLDLDFLFFERIRLMQTRKLDNQELKGRQIGASEKGAGGVIAWNFTFVDGSLNIIVGGVEEDALKTMRDANRGLKMLYNTQFYKERDIGGNSSTFIKSKNTESQIHCLTAKDNPQTASRFSPYWVWMEEIGKGKRGWSLDTASYIRPSIEAEGGIKTGWIHYIGTAGELDEGTYDLEERHYDPVEHKVLSFKNNFDEVTSDNLVGHFIPKTWFYKTDKDGNSFVEKSKQVILDERAKLKPREKFFHTTQYPIYASEAFYTQSGGFFGEEVVQLINERIAYINNHRDEYKEKRGYLRWKNPRNKKLGVEFEPNENGPFIIQEHPEEIKINNEVEVPFNLYRAGTDSYDQDIAFHSDSLGSCTIRKGFLSASHTYRKWVAKVIQRPSTEEGGADRFYENTALLCAYYNARNLIEFSKWRIIDWYIKNGCAWLLKERPEVVLASWIYGSKQSNRYGIDPSTKKDWLNLLRDELTPDNIQKMDDIEQMRKIAKFRYDPTGKKYNCDETISTALTLVHEYDEKDLTAGTTIEDKEKDTIVLPAYKLDENGNLVNVLNQN